MAVRIRETIERRYWSIGELAIKLSCSTSALRYYCTYFGIVTIRNGHNNRKFTKEDVEKLANILAYIKQGYHLKAIKNKI